MNNLVTLSKTIIKNLDSRKWPENSAIVFDIDDTLIDGFGRSIVPIIMVYNYSKLKNIIPVIITSRAGTPESIEFTQLQLLSHGITDYKFLYFRNPNLINPWEYKLNARKNIHDRGITVIMSLGDQDWDLGQYGGIGYKIPIPFQIIYNNSLY
jgi:hypothetical protein